MKSIPLLLRDELGPCELAHFDGLADDVDLHLSCISEVVEVNEGEPDLKCIKYFTAGSQGKTCMVKDERGMPMVLKEYAEGLDAKTIARVSILLGKLINDEHIVTTKRIWLKPSERGGGHRVWGLQPMVNGVDLFDVLAYYISSSGNEQPGKDQKATWKATPKEESKAPYELLLSVAYQTLTTLMKLEENGVVHMDLKVENIMLDEQGRIFLIDYDFTDEVGQADPGLTVGTAGYMGPERIMPEDRVLNGKIGHYTDMWALGATLYYLITAKHPLPDVEIEEAIERYDLEEVMASIPQDFETECLEPQNCPITYILRSCLQREPEKRKTAAELLAILFDKRPIQPNPEHFLPIFWHLGRANRFYGDTMVKRHGKVLFPFQPQVKTVSLEAGPGERIFNVALSDPNILDHVDNVVMAATSRKYKVDYNTAIPKLSRSYVWLLEKADLSKKLEAGLYLYYSYDVIEGPSLIDWWEDSKGNTKAEVYLRHGIYLLVDMLDFLNRQGMTMRCLTPQNIVWNFREEDGAYRVGIEDPKSLFDSIEPFDPVRDTNWDHPFIKAGNEATATDVLWNMAMAVASLLSPGVEEDGDVEDFLVNRDGDSDKVAAMVLQKVRSSYPKLSYELEYVLKQVLDYAMVQKPLPKLLAELRPLCIQQDDSGLSMPLQNDYSTSYLMMKTIPLVEMNGSTLNEWWKRYHAMPGIGAYLCHGLYSMIQILDAANRSRFELKSITPDNVIWRFDKKGELRVGLCHAGCDLANHSNWDSPRYGSKYDLSTPADALWNVAMSIISLFLPNIHQSKGIREMVTTGKPNLWIVEVIIGLLNRIEPRPAAYTYTLEFLLKRTLFQALAQQHSDKIPPIPLLILQIEDLQWPNNNPNPLGLHLSDPQDLETFDMDPVNSKWKYERAKEVMNDVDLDDDEVDKILSSLASNSSTKPNVKGTKKLVTWMDKQDRIESRRQQKFANQQAQEKDPYYQNMPPDDYRHLMEDLAAKQKQEKEPHFKDMSIEEYRRFMKDLDDIVLEIEEEEAQRLAEEKED